MSENEKRTEAEATPDADATGATDAAQRDDDAKSPAQPTPGATEAEADKPATPAASASDTETDPPLQPMPSAPVYAGPSEPEATSAKTSGATARETPPEAPVMSRKESSGRGNFAAALLGGLVAGGLGFAAAYYTEFGLLQSDDGDAPFAAISDSIDSQAARLDALESAAGNSADTDLQARIDEIGGQMSALADQVEGLGSAEDDGETVDLTGIEDRLAALEGQAGDTSLADTAQAQGEDLAALQEQVAALSQRVEEQSAAIEEAAGAASRETARIAAQAALSEIRAAIEAGEPYADAVGALEGAGDTDVPEALSAPAGQGIATLSALQSDFPPLAREALGASVGQTAGDGVVDRMGAFLRAQTGARSLSEQQGDGADAILSRAEARLSEGELDAALTEIDSLPEDGQAVFADWTDRARTRLEARSALSDLSQSVNNN